MKVNLCDLCSNPIDFDKLKTTFKNNEKTFRFALLEVHIKNGVRWKEADVCSKCMKSFLKKKFFNANI